MSFDKNDFLSYFFLLALFYKQIYLSMHISFIKKKSSNTSYKTLKPISNHHSRVTAKVSSKLFTKFSRFRNIHSKIEKTLNILKFVRLSSSFSKLRRSFTNAQMDLSLKNFSSTKYKSTSLLNGRCLSVSNDFKVSRISLRKLASAGVLPGVFKSSW